MLLYCPKITDRLLYISKIIFDSIGIDWFELSDNIIDYKNYNGAKINYSDSSISENECWIKPVALLFEEDVRPQIIEVFQWRNMPAFYKSNNVDFPFDVFAASFYLLTRYEEYLRHELDMYGRYSHTNSLAFKYNFLKLPLVNLWLKELAIILCNKFPLLKLTPQTFAYLPTYDIDIAYSYSHKGWLRNAGGFARDFIGDNFKNISQRADVLLHQRKDPFDSYEWLDELHKECSLKPVYFFLVANRNSKYDKNILPNNHAYRQLIDRHSKQYQIGIHPSWQSGDDAGLIKQERKCLIDIIGQTVNKSRQHYIRMKLPGTYQQLIRSGITEDYSMGYGSINGYRASYCMPYNWYDLANEKITSLTIFPFCFMDANSFYEQQFTTLQTVMELEYYYETTKQVNGLFVTIWHNHFLGTDKMFAGWKELYEAFIRKHFC